MAGRVGNRLFAILRWFPIASYALAHVVVGFWAYIVAVQMVDPGPDPDSRLLNLDTDSSLLSFFLVTAILMVPVGAVLGVVDAAARRSGHPLLLVLDTLLIVIFPLVWIVQFVRLLSYNDCDAYTCVDVTLNWPMYIGLLIGAELGLVVLLGVSVRWNRRKREEARRVGS